MNILLVTPVPRTSQKGNRMTTDRWERLLTELGHDVRVRQSYTEEDPDLLLALHARRSADSIRRFREHHPDRPLVLALTGTDVYRDIHENDRARASLDRADRYIVLQPRALDELPASLRERGHVIYQSIRERPEPAEPLQDVFEVTVIGHLRSVKDPFRAEEASRHLPEHSRITITHIGGILEEELEAEAERRTEENERYQWIGAKPRDRTLHLLSRSRLLVHSSTMEGGAHVISEAIACETPILASDISGNKGMLGDSYPGYFPVRREEALAEQLLRAETDEAFYRNLKDHLLERREIVDPEREKRDLDELLRSFDR